MKRIGLPQSDFWQGTEALNLETIQTTNRLSRVGTALSRNVQDIAESLVIQDAEEAANEQKLREAERVSHVS